MSYIIDVVLTLTALGVAIPALVLFLECLLALFPTRVPLESARPERTPKVIVLIPAHNEEAVIDDILARLPSELGADDGILVVADNCTDRTATIARAAGARVMERFDAQQRGKGFALDCGLEYLAEAPPDVVVVLDADCRIAPGLVRRLAEVAVTYERPAQAQDVLALPQRPSPLTRVSALAFLVRNHVRSTGLQRLGLPCQLMGTGMAFPWKVIRAIPPVGSHLAEDRQMGLDLLMRGFAPMYCAEACVTSVAAQRPAGARSQRRRWEHGHMTTLLDRAPKLIAGGMAGGRWGELAIGLDLLVPPLALFAVLLSIVLTIGWGWATAGGSSLPFGLATGALVLFGTAVFVAWVKYGRETLPARYVPMVPLYVAWKVPLYLSFLVRGPYRHWDRTERSISPSG